MIFWALVLLISLVLVVGVAAPLLRLARMGHGVKQTPPTILQMSALGGLVVTPLAAALIYLSVGAPESLSPDFQKKALAQAQDTATAITALSPDERAAMIESMVEDLAMRLEQSPDNIEDWKMLARSYAVLGRASESAAAYRELFARSGEPNMVDWRNYAIALLSAHDSEAVSFNEELVSALNKLLEYNENDALALFYLGLDAKEQGDADKARALWIRLQESLPPDAPIMPQLQSLIEELHAAPQ